MGIVGKSYPKQEAVSDGFCWNSGGMSIRNKWKSVPGRCVNVVIVMGRAVL